MSVEAYATLAILIGLFGLPKTLLGCQLRMLSPVALGSALFKQYPHRSHDDSHHPGFVTDR
jgi:hypothetical protein